MKFFTKLFIIFFTLSILLGFLSSASAQDYLKKAKIVELEGNVYIKKSGGEKKYSAFSGMSLTSGDTIITSCNAFAKLEIDKETTLKISEKTIVTISELLNSKDKSEKTVFNLQAGKLLATVKKLLNINSQFIIKTPTIAMGVRGTKFFAEVNKSKETTTLVLEGKVDTSYTKTFTSLKNAQEILLERYQQIKFLNDFRKPFFKYTDSITYPQTKDLDLLVLEDILENPAGMERYLVYNFTDILNQKRIEASLNQEDLKETSPNIIYDREVIESNEDSTIFYEDTRTTSTITTGDITNNSTDGSVSFSISDDTTETSSGDFRSSSSRTSRDTTSDDSEDNNGIRR